MSDLNEVYEDTSIKIAQADKSISDIETDTPAEIIKVYKEEVLPLYEELQQVVQWKSFLKLDQWLKQFKSNGTPLELETLINNKTMLDLEKEVLNYLEFSKEEYYRRLEHGIYPFKVYMREKLEVLVSKNYELLKDLQSDSRIGQYGQRLPTMYDNARNSYPMTIESDPVTMLINAKEDIIKLIHTTIDTAMKYQAFADLNLMLDYTQAKTIIDNDKKINEQKMQIEKNAQTLKDQEFNIKNGNKTLKQIEVEGYKPEDIIPKTIIERMEPEPNELLAKVQSKEQIPIMSAAVNGELIKEDVKIPKKKFDRKKWAHEYYKRPEIKARYKRAHQEWRRKNKDKLRANSHRWEQQHKKAKK